MSNKIINQAQLHAMLICMDVVHFESFIVISLFLCLQYSSIESPSNHNTIILQHATAES